MLTRAQYTPKYSYTSELAGITLTLVGDYELRNEILSALYRHSKTWLGSALAASPLEMIGLLQDYLDVDQSIELRADSGMGKAVAVEIARMMPQSAREGERCSQRGPRHVNDVKTAGLPNYGGWKADTTSAFASAFGTRHTYGSEAKTLMGLGR
jgi:phosphatidylinositol 4-kinase